MHPATRPTLILRLRDGSDAEAWTRFVEIYGPLLLAFCSQRGLQSADARDVTQEIFRAVAAVVGRFDYDPRRGTFRSWLHTIARHKLADFFAASARTPLADADAQSRAEGAQDDSSPDWEAEYRRHLLRWAMEKARGEFTEKSWAAFERMAFAGEDGAQVAVALGLSAGAAYVARSRITARLRGLIATVDDECDPSLS